MRAHAESANLTKFAFSMDNEVKFDWMRFIEFAENWYFNAAFCKKSYRSIAAWICIPQISVHTRERYRSFKLWYFTGNVTNNNNLTNFPFEISNVEHVSCTCHTIKSIQYIRIELNRIESSWAECISRRCVHGYTLICTIVIKSNERMESYAIFMCQIKYNFCKRARKRVSEREREIIQHTCSSSNRNNWTINHVESRSFLWNLTKKKTDCEKLPHLAHHFHATLSFYLFIRV